MSLLEDIKKLESLFEQVKETTGYLVVEPKMYDPLEHTDFSREMGVPDWDPQGFLPGDLPRDDEGIKESRDWILKETDERYAPGPNDYSKIDTNVYKSIEQWMQEARDPMPSAWVAYAKEELERTGARRAIPNGFKDDGLWFPDQEGTIYVGAPPK